MNSHIADTGLTTFEKTATPSEVRANSLLDFSRLVVGMKSWRGIKTMSGAMHPHHAQVEAIDSLEISACTPCRPYWSKDSSR